MYSTKHKLDKFYTKPSIAQMCLDTLNIGDYDLVIEPSAGGGSFSNNICHNNLISLDLEPEFDDIIKQDWFEYDINSQYNNVLIVGNPPFGKRNKLSKQFLEHCFSFNNVQTVAFILPHVYKKHTLQKIIPVEYRISSIIDLPSNSFTIDGEDYHVPCSFFVFDKSVGEDLRFDIELYSSCDDFEFSTKNDYDFFIMGASPNVIKKTPTSTNRGYYIKSLIDPDTLMNNIKNTKFESLSSVNGGVAWRTKPEIIKSYMDGLFTSSQL